MTEDTMTTEPVNPGPLVMSDLGFGKADNIVAVNLMKPATHQKWIAPADPGEIANFNSGRPDWQGHAAWLVRASGAYEPMRDRNAALVEALTLVLPMAKGYAHAHRVGSNEAKVEQAEAVLAQATGAPETGE